MDNLCHKTAAVSTIWLHHKNAFCSKSSCNLGRPFCRLSMRETMYLPSPHGQTFLPIFEKYIQAPPTPLHIPEQTQPFPTFTHISAHLPYTGPHIQTDLAKHTIKGCKVVFSRTVSMPLGLERHLWKCRIEWGESQPYEQI